MFPTLAPFGWEVSRRPFDSVVIVNHDTTLYVWDSYLILEPSRRLYKDFEARAGGRQARGENLGAAYAGFAAAESSGEKILASAFAVHAPASGLRIAIMIQGWPGNATSPLVRYSLVKVLLTVSPFPPSFSLQLPCAFTADRFFNPLFSPSYKTLLEQPLSFHIYMKRGVWVFPATSRFKLPDAQSRQLFYFQRAAASYSLLPLFFTLAPFVFKSLQPLLPKTGGWVYPASDQDSRRAQSCKISRSQMGRFGLRGCGKSVGIRPVNCRNTAAECLYAGTGSRNATFPRYCRASDNA